MPVWSPPDTVAVVIDIVVWAVWGTLVGYVFHRLPAGWFAADDASPGSGGGSAAGQFWADHTGGATVEESAARGRRAVRRRVLETTAAHPRPSSTSSGSWSRRAGPSGCTGWWLAIAPLFFLWNTPWLAGVMVLYGVAANLPCLITQRYNRARLLRILDRASRHASTPT